MSMTQKYKSVLVKDRIYLDLIKHSPVKRVGGGGGGIEV